VLLLLRLIDYGLRDYGTAKWEGGDPNCEHLGKLVSSRAGFNERYFGKPSSDGNKQDALREPMGQVCAKCGAVRIDNQIGLEQTPDEYIANLVDVFRECKRILRDDGTLWVNIGDSYASNGEVGQTDDATQWRKGVLENGKRSRGRGAGNGIKPKDLIGIPWMLAFALRADGWYLRQDIIWAKPNPMPESVKDRCTKSHEYIFLLSKSARYYYDNEAVKEQSKEPEDNRGERGNRKRFPTDKIAGIRGPGVYPMANKRDVWTVTTKPYKGAHYATFPPELITPCILAGAPEDGIVFDPFVGSGTTVATAVKLGRRGVGLDLSMKYLRENARERIYQEEMQPVLCTR